MFAREDDLNRAAIGGVLDTATYSVVDLDLTNSMTVFLTVSRIFEKLILF
jgi:hypothetical protein